jgi:hypothetical protein
MAGRASIGQISESEYTNLLQALSSTTKGRSFLTEYLRRSRPQDMLTLLDSLRRIETTMTSVRDQLKPERIAIEMLAVAMTLELAVEGAAADSAADEIARRFALIDRARNELTALAKSLGGGLASAPEKPVGEAAIRLIDDERTFLKDLGLGDQDLPADL